MTVVYRPKQMCLEKQMNYPRGNGFDVSTASERLI